jgi:hypothetical protein
MPKLQKAISEENVLDVSSRRVSLLWRIFARLTRPTYKRKGKPMPLIGRFIAMLFGLVWVSNGCLMLVFPRAWFKWSRQLGLQGALTEEKYSGRGAIEVRALGAVFLGGFGWIIYDMLFSR